MAQKERRNEQGGADRRQNRTILGRTIFLMAVFGVVAFVPLLWKLWQIQIVDYRFYQEKAISQQTRDMLVTAPRGTIYVEEDPYPRIAYEKSPALEAE